MKRLAFVVAVAGTVAIAPPAGAGVLELDAQVQAGGMAGKGFRGDRRSEAFHDHATGASYGALVGVEFLFIDVWVEHNQYVNNSQGDGAGVNGTWTQFMTGLDIQFDVGEKVGQVPLQGQRDKRHHKGYGALGIGFGFGVGTGQQVDPPLDNSEVTDKGVIGQLHLDFGYRLNEVMSLGIHIPVQVGYLFRNEPAEVDPMAPAANDPSSWYSTFGVSGFVTLRANFAIK